METDVVDTSNDTNGTLTNPLSEVQSDELYKQLQSVWVKLEEELNSQNESTLNVAENISKYITEITEILINSSNEKQLEDIACAFCIENNPYYRIYSWTGQHRECLKVLASKQLEYFHQLVWKANVKLLSCREIYVPLFLLLLSLKPSDKRKVPPDIEILYSKILYNISLKIIDNNFLDILGKDINVNESFIIPKFTFFDLLMNYTHHAIPAGQYARDGILSCIKLSKTNAQLEEYISQSCIGVIIAGGLSAYYSSLPTTFEIQTEEWHMISKHDLNDMKELEDFLRALQFCCDVLENSNTVMQKRLMELIHDGFLLSVLVPALNQSSVEAQVTVMAYLELFLRSISSERIMEVFLRVLMTEAYDHKPLIDLLIYHINSESVQLSTVAIQLFKTLLELNCEDVLFNLIFRYLLPCHHILPNQKRTIKEMDFYCKSATMFLYITPSCCIETNKNPVDDEESPKLTRSDRSMSSMSSSGGPTADSSPSISRKASVTNSISSIRSRSSIPPELTQQQTLDFMGYLYDAKSTITACKKACRCWSAVYDGMDVVTENPRFSALQVTRLSSSVEGDSIISFVRSPSIASVKSNDSDVTPVFSDIALPLFQTTDCLGPFLNALLTKIESMLENNLYLNLLLTSLVTRLASYPQPLLRSFLLNSNLVIQPGVRSLAQVLTRVSFAVDGFLLQLDDYKSLILKARQNLIRRETRRFKRLSQEIANDINSNEESEESVTINIDTHTGLGRFQKVDNGGEKNGRVMGIDEIVSLAPNNAFSQLSINTSPIIEEKGLASHFIPQSHGKLHPVIPKVPYRSPKWRRKVPTKNDLIDMRKRNPVAIKNAVYCAVILEEFMKELAAISIEQTLL